MVSQAKGGCKVCKSMFHTKFSCPQVPRKAIKQSTKPIAKVGKQGKKTAAAVAKWKRTQEPNHEGYYICYICKKWIPYLEAEHKQSKARRPDLRTDPKNLAPVCSECNEEKQSNNYEEMK